MARALGSFGTLLALMIAAVGCSSNERAAADGSARGMIAVRGKSRKAISCALIGAAVDEALRIRLDDDSSLTIPLKEAGLYYSPKGGDRGDHMDCEEARSDAGRHQGGAFQGSLTRRCTKGLIPIDISVVVDCPGQNPAAKAPK